MPYLQSLKKGETLSGYHVARWHPSGKLWISSIELPDETTAQGDADWINNQLADTDYGLPSRFFVWHAGLTKADLEAHKAESPSNKIK